MDDLDFYTLRHGDLSKKTGASPNTVTAMLEILKMRSNRDFSKKVFENWLYSQKAVTFIKDQLMEHPGRAWYAEFLEIKRSAREARKRREAEELAQRIAERAADAAHRKGEARGWA